MKRTLVLVTVITLVICMSGCASLNDLSAEIKDVAADVSSASESRAKETISSDEISSIKIEIGVMDLLAAYDENEIAAKKEYEGNNIRVTGLVNSIGQDIADKVYVTINDGSDTITDVVFCYFKSQAEIDKVALLKKGDAITVVGTVGNSVMSLDMNYCIIEKMPE